MKYLLIGVGGTGAKILESVVYLAAAGINGGFRGNVDEIEMRFIDMDAEGGNFKRLEDLLKLYKEMYEHMQDYEKAKIANSEDKMFNTDGKTWKPIKITYERFVPGGQNPQNSKFRGNIDFNTVNKLKDLITGSDDNIKLAEFFYTEDLLTKLDLRKGSRGDPSIGSIVWGKWFDDEAEDTNADGFWKNLITGKYAVPSQDADGIRVIFVGSVFGGTGASGLPTITSKFHEKYIKGKDSNGNTKLGAVFMLPYFTFAKGNPKDGQQANPDNFSASTKLALKYYYDSDVVNILDGLYLIGGNQRIMRDEAGETIKFEFGGPSQINPAMPEELVAALAVFDFFNEKTGQFTDERKIRLAHTVAATASKDENVYVPPDSKITWNSFPQNETLSLALNRLLRLSLFWNGFLDNHIMEGLPLLPLNNLAFVKHGLFGNRPDTKHLKRDKWRVDDASRPDGTIDTLNYYEFFNRTLNYLAQLEQNGLMFADTEQDKIPKKLVDIKKIKFNDIKAEKPNTYRLDGADIGEYTNKLINLADVRVDKDDAKEQYERVLSAIMSIIGL
ncbi:MAG: tubulin-like doman-containing protein [Oscillospiraceae bacterium]|jgi:hypothetical protein|nr:tubulin-like doman-containing protein [Oscillospiraceae bacterium]